MKHSCLLCELRYKVLLKYCGAFSESDITKTVTEIIGLVIAKVMTLPIRMRVLARSNESRSPIEITNVMTAIMPNSSSLSTSTKSTFVSCSRVLEMSY